jgi:hypothetical protein
MAAPPLVAPVPLVIVEYLKLDKKAGLAAPRQEWLAAARAASVMHADAMSWRQAGNLHWLLVAATARVAMCTTHARPGGMVLKALLGSRLGRILCR